MLKNVNFTIYFRVVTTEAHSDTTTQVQLACETLVFRRDCKIVHPYHIGKDAQSSKYAKFHLKFMEISSFSRVLSTAKTSQKNISATILLTFDAVKTVSLISS